jgi:hypothetical protein
LVEDQIKQIRERLAKQLGFVITDEPAIWNETEAKLWDALLAAEAKLEAER